MWTYNRTDGWIDSEVKNPSDLVPKSTTYPKKDGPVAVIGVENAYAAGDHVHKANTCNAKP
jgi:hypothetical protein